MDDAAVARKLLDIYNEGVGKEDQLDPEANTSLSASDALDLVMSSPIMKDFVEMLTQACLYCWLKDNETVTFSMEDLLNTTFEGMTLIDRDTLHFTIRSVKPDDLRDKAEKLALFMSVGEGGTH